ncbi:MAG: hypothetical protein KBT48_04225 [Firmicutes bacterium]|nr:hypothetical protein [Bacillota bacterium]
MKKLSTFFLICALFVSLFGCTKPEPKPTKPEKKPEPEVVENAVNPEEQFLASVPEWFHALFEHIQLQLSLQNGTMDHSKLAYFIPEYNATLYFGQEDDVFSISVLEQTESPIKEICMKECDPNIAPIIPSILKLVSENGSINFDGNTFSQDGDLFTISLNSQEKGSFNSSMKALLTTYKNLKVNDLERLQLAINTYAQVLSTQYNAISLKKSITGPSSIEEHDFSFVQDEIGRVETLIIDGDKPSVSYIDELGSLHVSKGQEATTYVLENPIDAQDTFISLLSLDRLISLSALKMDSLAFKVSMTNTAMFVTIEGKTQEGNQPYSGTIIFMEDEISVTESISKKDKEQSTYNFDSLGTMSELRTKIYEKAYTYKELKSLLKG